MTDRAAVSVLERAINNFRGELLQLDARALQAQVELYAPVRERLLSRVAALEAQLADSGNLSIADALRLGRAKELLAQTEDELARLAPRVEAVIVQYRQQAITLAQDHAQGLTLVSAAQGGPQTYASVQASWTRLNTGAVEQILGRLTNESPLRKLLDEIGGDAGHKIAEKLKEQIALGSHPRGVAAALAKEVDVPAARLLLISRTEALNSYRGATVAAYQANSDILDGYIWTCSKSSRTCLACLSQDGAHYGLDTSFSRQHPACRCAYRPSLIGIDNHELPNGRDWFYRQPVKDQLRMLPESAREEFRRGDLDLADFVKVDHSDEWGDSHRVSGVGFARDRAKERRASGSTLPKPEPRQRTRTRGGDDRDELVTVTERAA